MLRYIEPFTAVLHDEDNDQRVCTLLWGDPVQVLDSTTTPWLVRARGFRGRLEPDVLCSRSLLELYVIDAGQADALLMKTPDEKWHLIDAGASNATTMLHKGAANFLRWKFQDELGSPGVTLETAILTHPDADHFGGFIDVLAGDLHDGRTFPIQVERFLHPGLGRFADEPTLGQTTRGTVDPFPAGEHGLRRTATFVTELLDGRESFVNRAERPFAREFATFAQLVATVPRAVRRISRGDAYLPGYGIGDGPVQIKVLAPVLEEFMAEHPAGRAAGLRVLGSGSKTCNGDSVVLRVDYDNARILLTGDQNAQSQQLLLSYVPVSELAADVMKASHHGSDDVDFDYLQAVGARATVISSGDCEDYGHPRPVLVGACGRYGRDCVDADGRSAPSLVYSTEIARSIRLARVADVAVPVDGQTVSVDAAKARVRADDGGAIYRPLSRTPIATDLVYGLVNIRTDGRYILCATMAEKGAGFDVQVFQAGVVPAPVRATPRASTRAVVRPPRQPAGAPS